MSALYKRGEYWHVAYHRNGKRVYRTTKVKVSVDPGETIARQVQRDLDSTDAKVTAGIFDHRTPVADAAKLIFYSQTPFLGGQAFETLN